LSYQKGNVNRKQRSILFIIICFILSGCGSGKALTPAAATIPQTTIPIVTTMPTVSSTITPTIDFYTEEERAVDGKTWFAKDFLLSAYDSSGKGVCIPPTINLEKFSTLVFQLPEPGEILEFGENRYSRTAPNFWTCENCEGLFGVKVSGVLELTENQIISTDTLVSTTNQVVTCVNTWTVPSKLKMVECSATAPYCCRKDFLCNEKLTSKVLN
jgi:hypothetical protein